MARKRRDQFVKHAAIREYQRRTFCEGERRKRQRRLAQRLANDPHVALYRELKAARSLRSPSTETPDGDNG